MATDPMALANALDPSLYQQQLQAQQQQQLATLLMQQGLTPMGGTDSVGGVAIRRSPMEGAAKLAAILSGQSLQGQANDKSAALMMGQMAALRSPRGFGVDVPGASQDAPQGTPQGAPQGAAPQGQGQALAMAMGGGGQPANVQSQTTPAGAIGLPGMAPMDAYRMFISNPDKFNDAYLKGYTPNDTTIQARQGNVDPVMANRLALIKNSTDPKILGMQQAGMSPEMIYNAVFGEAAKNAEIDRKKSNEFKNLLTGESGIVPDMPPNSNPVGPPLPNGAIPGVTQMPGAPGIVSTNANAEAAGKAQGASPYEMVEVKLPDNRIQMMTRADAAKYYGNVTAPPPTAVPSVGSPAPGAPPVMPGRPTGQSTTDKLAQEQAATVISSAPAMGVQAKQSIVGLEDALKIVEDGLKTGPGISGRMQTIAVMNNLGIPLGKTDADNYQSLNKYLQNSLNQATQGTGASGSDTRFESFSHGQPNAETMSGAPLAGAIRYVLSQQDAALARSNYIGQTYPRLSANGDPNAAITTQQTWTGLAQPKFFEIQRMHPTEQAAAINDLSTKDAEKFIQWRADMAPYR